jgi:hypothetical protein
LRERGRVFRIYWIPLDLAFVLLLFLLILLFLALIDSIERGGCLLEGLGLQLRSPFDIRKV